ncbi:hypothetical protein [Paenibacillus spongiae]|uniref:Pre-toxin TG domain-containing protein n=1 Tax=Paenibacillus spongiae TaxID=2909671 RepID=A0ABY5S5U0_9BACL|nr:hypothetical protein [Paenibacillus spongiae]UVI29272.1 hypothetical protein L1F29_28205 [Paenibacillus spongiae]
MGNILEDLLNYPKQKLGILGLAELDRYWERIQLGLDRMTALNEVTNKYMKTIATRGTPIESEGSKVQVLPLSVSLAALEIMALYAAYDELAKKEYAEIRQDLKPDFDSRAASKGMAPWQYYQWLRKYYYAKGVKNPPSEVNKIKRDFKFLGRIVTGGVHPDFEKVLRQAEQTINGYGKEVANQISQAISNEPIGGFVPRPLNNEKSLSLHALGRAIDIDAPWNPHLIGNKAQAIDKILEDAGIPERVKEIVGRKEVSKMDEKDAEESYEKIKKTSETVQKFLDDWLPEWEKEQQAEKQEPPDNETDDQKKNRENREKKLKLLENLLIAFEVLKTNKKGDILRDKNGKVIINVKKLQYIKLIQQKGLITIPLELYKALAKHGAHLGIEYHEAKDIMHIELSPQGWYGNKKKIETK